MPEIEEAGGRIVAVTQGDPQQAQALCDRFSVPFPCLADAERKTYRAFGLKRGSLSEVVGPAAIARGMEAAAKGHFVERIVGDAFQMPGTFIVDVDGIVRYARYARHSGDHPPASDVVAALRALNEGAG